MASRNSRTMRSRRPPAGFSLVELMVSIALGLVIITSMAVMLASDSRSLQEMGSSSDQIESGRYSTEFLLRDLRLAGYYGEFDPETLPLPTAVPDPSRVDAASLGAALPIAVQGYHFGVDAAMHSVLPAGVAALLADRRARSDVLVVRRVSTCIAGPAAPGAGCDAMDTGRRTYFQTSLCQSQRSSLPAATLFAVGTDQSVFTANNPAITASPTFLTQRDCVTPSPVRSFSVRLYYVANNNRAGDGVPTLKLVELGSGAFAPPVAVAEGVESMQIEYGVDADHDGVPALYSSDPGNAAYQVDPAAPGPAWPAGTTYPGAVETWHSVTAVKINILARNSRAAADFTDRRRYVLGSTPGSDNTLGPYGDGYRRHVYATTARLMNVAGRLE